MVEEFDARLQISAPPAAITSVHDQVANLFMHCRYNANAQDKRQVLRFANSATGYANSANTAYVILGVQRL